MLNDTLSPIISEDEISGAIFIDLPKEIYHRDAVLKAVYAYSDRFYVKLAPHEEFYVRVMFEAKTEAKVDVGLAAKCFCNDVIDQQIREDLARTNGHIRNIIYEHAFAPIKDLEDVLAS